MSTEPSKQDRLEEMLDPNATGAFVPKTDQDLAIQPPSAATPTPDATGMYLPADSFPITMEQPAAPNAVPAAGTVDFNQPPAEATGLYVPQPTQQPGRQPSVAQGPGSGATGVYLPGGTQTPDGGSTRARNGPAATDPAGATGTYAPNKGSPEAATGDFTPTGAPPPAARPAPVAPRCGRYVLNRFHAKGGMGEIWLAHDPAIGRSVALKRMLKSGPDKENRFRIEAQVTGQLEHPGIIPVHELGVNAEGQPFYVMKFVHGRTLQKVIEEYHKPGSGASGDREVQHLRLLQIFVSLCQTVAYAHSRGVLHRDLKPENVMLGPYGETLLLDWGIAKVLGQPESSAGAGEAAYVHLHDLGAETGTQVGAIMGSPSYMAPEVAAGRTAEVDQRSDVYLLGATLYEILTGRRPRQGKTVMEMIKRARTEPPASPRKVSPQVPRALDAICLKAMALQKADRYASALELAEEVQRFMAGEPVGAYPEGPLARAWRWARKHRKALLRSAAAALVLGLGVFTMFTLLEAQRLKAQDRARGEVKEFRRLADEARYYAATTDPIAENAPYFDPRKGELTARAALALAAPWGPGLEKLPLPQEVAALKKETYDLLLLLVQAQSRRPADAPATREMLPLLDQAGQLRPPSPSYYRLRSVLHERLGEHQEALVDRHRAENPQALATALDHFLVGEQLRTQAAGRPEDATPERKAWQPDPTRMEKAIDAYRRALRIDPEHYWSHFQLGRCYLSLGRTAEAVEALGACVALRPEAPWGYSVRGLALAQQKRYAEAERDLDRAIELSPDARSARLNRGVVYWKQEKTREALDDLGEVLQPPTEKQLVEAAYYRGQMYLQRGRVAKALEDFDQVVAANPHFRPVYPLRARIYIAQGDTARALKDLDSYLAGGGKPELESWKTHAQRGRMLRLLYAELPTGKRQEPSSRALANLAVTQLLRAVSLGGQAAQVFDDLAAMLEHTGRLDEALDAYSQGLKLEPRNVKLLLKRGWAWELKSQHAKARADFAAAARVDPENAEAHSGLGYEQALGKQAPEAQSQADLALLHGADNYLILHNVACIYAALSQAGGPQADAHQEVAIALLRRAIHLWKMAGTGLNEIELIKSEGAFQPLRDRADFQELIRGDLKDPRVP